MLSDELDNLLSEMDLFKGIENYLELFQKTSPHIFKRKIRHNFRKGKFHYRTILVVNRLHDFMLPPNLMLKPFLRRLESSDN